MTSEAYSSHPVLAVTADVLLPSLGVLTLLLPSLAWRAGRLSNPRLLGICGLVSIILVYILRDANVRTGLLMGMFGARFSSHTAVAISFGVTLMAFQLSLLPVVVAAISFYMWLITYLQYHAPIDALLTTAIILPLSLLCHVPWWRQRRSPDRAKPRQC